MSKEQEEQEFRVTDKRLFREDGEIRDQQPADELKEERKPEAAKSAETKPPPDKAAQEVLAHIDFTSYILSYYTQGLVLLGEVPNPYTNKKEEDVEGARHMVDILSMLQEKTKGNLTDEERQLLESVLYELRMKYMAKTNRIKL